MSITRSPLRGRYLVRNPIWNAWLRTNDFVLDAFRRTESAPPLSSPPRRVLLAVGGHLGDSVIATAMFAQVRSVFPDAELGVVTGTWNRRVFERHELVRWLHLVDHWKLDRSREALPVRWWRTRRTQAAARDAIAAVGYGLAIDLYAYYPNSARLLAQSGIPVRVGFRSGGDGAFYTHAVDFAPGNHVTMDQTVLLRALLGGDLTAPARYALAGVARDVAERAERKLEAAGVESSHYVVIHPGAGTSRKEWHVDGWRSVAAALRQGGLHVVLTGAGPSDRRLSAQVAADGAAIANLCDQLTWEEFQHVVSRARAVLAVDTVAGHLAAAAGVPSVTLMTGMDDPGRWRPLGDRNVVLSIDVPCAPCYRSNGCGLMSCVREVTADQVVAAAMSAMAETSAGVP